MLHRIKRSRWVRTRILLHFILLFACVKTNIPYLLHILSDTTLYQTNGTRHHLWVSQGTVWQFVWQAVKGLFTIKDFLIRRQLMQDRIHKDVLLNLASGTFKDNWCVLSDVCSSQTKNALSYGLSGDGRVTWYTWSKCRCNNIKWKIHGSEELREPQTQKKEKMD